MGAIGWGMALPLLGLPVGLSARNRSASFPSAPIRLTRILERGLGDGKALIVTRVWECRFSRVATGARIEARQVDVDVVAPPVLSALADFEAKREVTGLFPMSLDESGLIVDWSGQETSVDRAVDLARRELAHGQLTASEKQNAARYIAEMGRIAAELVSKVPRDLFFPETGTREEQRELELPGGSKGRYELTIAASAQGSGGLLKQSERRIVTRIGQSSRVSRETWSVA